MIFGHTPRFTIRIWGSPGTAYDRLADAWWPPQPRRRMPVAEIEVDTTDGECARLEICNHRGCEVINQKMLLPVPDQPTLWHQEGR